MGDSAPSVVVGVDGSKAAVAAARWAIDEAVSRDIPLRLVCVIEAPESQRTGDRRLAAARSALQGARRAVEEAGQPAKVETEILWGKPLAGLLEESRSAAMICVGSIGLDHAAHGVGSLSASLAASALCPVAVIRHPTGRRATARVGRVTVQADNAGALRHAFEEARLRQAPLRAIALSGSAGPDDVAKRSAQAQLRRRIARWTRQYPDVRVESAVVRGSVDDYLAAHHGPDQLFVTDARGCYDLCGAHNAGTSVLATRSSNL
ncbi:universal stress protein [Mycobacterium terramassiliense]|uniref:Universal stress protein n=1 Tax=Mycobacterium terramassiliense TaxID=1841859 RepID=A0A2U3N9W3_9MYCO|nr:universal stress protein [Mycobacterium terramassiliense]SPM28280.1 universal stress protein [Mycobacterium terramassiliense]